MSKKTVRDTLRAKLLLYCVLNNIPLVSMGDHGFTYYKEPCKKCQKEYGGCKGMVEKFYIFDLETKEILIIDGSKEKIKTFLKLASYTVWCAEWVNHI